MTKWIAILFVGAALAQQPVAVVNTPAVSQSGTWNVSAAQSGSWNVSITGSVAATQSGTWTVHPGNTANTTPWLVTGAGQTFPVTGTFWQATQPVSIAATVNVSAAQSGTWTVTGAGGTFPVTGTFWQATQPVSGTVTATQSAATIPTVTVMQNAATANGNGSSLTSTGYATCMVQVTGTSGGVTTVNFEATADGSTWVAILAHQLGAAGTLAATTTTDGDFRINCAGLSAIRARISAYSAGTITVNGYTTPLSAQPTTVSLAGTSQVVGAAASGASPSGNPVSDGALAEQAALPTAVSNAQMVRILADRYGRLYAISPVTSNASSAGTPITTNTNTLIVAAPSAGSHLRIHRIWAQNAGSVGTWCYWGNGSGVKTIPFYLAQYQPFSMDENGRWELSSATGLYLNTATTGASIEWYVEYETVVD